jgi:transforming growth factor-beta-induced protein
LVKAITGAGLVATLDGNGPFTVFAPTDAAFDKLPKGTIEELLKMENKQKLINLLKYHVIDRYVAAANISAMSLPAQVETLLGLRAIIDKEADKVKINGATIVTPDVMATNGIIHAIDTVLEPPTDIFQTANSSNFTILIKAITAADLVATLKGNGSFTVFAPTDAAFGKLPNGILAHLLKSENEKELMRVITYHVINQVLTVAAINRMTSAQTKLRTLSGDSLQINKNGKNITINTATLSPGDIFNTNGIIHVIDEVLMPSTSKANAFDLKQGYFVVLLTAIAFAYHLFA